MSGEYYRLFGGTYGLKMERKPVRFYIIYPMIKKGGYMEITILGSGTCVPSLKRGSPGLILRIGGKVLLFDSGTGTLERMLKRGITYLDLDLVLYTHTHPDHVADLVPLIFACKYGENPRRRDLPIIGGKGFKTYFQAIQEVYGHWLQPNLFRINITEVYDDILDYDLFRVIVKPMAHVPESVGYRVESNDGKSIVISGDTDYCPHLVELARDVDVLVIESALPDEMKAEGHLTPALAGRIGKEANCKKMLLTHLYPVCDTVDITQQCRKEYQGELLIAEDLMEISH